MWWPGTRGAGAGAGCQTSCWLHAARDLAFTKIRDSRAFHTFESLELPLVNIAAELVFCPCFHLALFRAQRDSSTCTRIPWVFLSTSETVLAVSAGHEVHAGHQERRCEGLEVQAHDQ